MGAELGPNIPAEAGEMPDFRLVYPAGLVLQYDSMLGISNDRNTNVTGGVPSASPAKLVEQGNGTQPLEWSFVLGGTARALDLSLPHGLGGDSISETPLSQRRRALLVAEESGVAINLLQEIAEQSGVDISLLRRQAAGSQRVRDLLNKPRPDKSARSRP